MSLIGKSKGWKGCINQDSGKDRGEILDAEFSGAPCIILVIEKVENFNVTLELDFCCDVLM